MENLDEQEYFDLFDMKELLVLNGFISSSGATGIQALQKGDNLDRSKDKTYNQCKMYAEIFRSLGLISSVDKALDYHISIFGRHVLKAKVKPQFIFEYCLLGMENPNGVLKIDRDYRLRPFLSILKCAYELDGYITRDEMIYGPLFLKDDSDSRELKQVCDEILALRKDKKEFGIRLNEKYLERGISATTAGNYTRFPIAAIQWVNWFTKIKNQFHLTEYGHITLSNCISKYDLRFDDIKDQELLVNASKFAYYEFLSEYGYELGSLSVEHAKAKNNLPKCMTDNGLLFSPFSAVHSKVLSDIFSFTIPSKKRESIIAVDTSVDVNKSSALATPFRLIKGTNNIDNDYSTKLRNLLSKHEPEYVLKIIKSDVKRYKKEEFYPWISDVFSVFGITCNIPQHGNNSVRWDAILFNEDNSDSVPIELKSPTEELHISTKAIRQALENKVVLQSRKAVPNLNASSTLAIGFELPNKRSEVDALISAFHKTFGFNIAVIGTEYLIKLSIKCIQEGKKLPFTDFTNIRGVINE